MIEEIKITNKDIKNINIRNFEKFKSDKKNYSKTVVLKPWGYEYLIYGNNDLAIWILHLNKKNECTSFHSHFYKDTSLFVLKGKIKFKSYNKTIALNEGSGVRISKKTFHQSINISNSETIIMEIETPNIKRDLIRLKDNYGRENQGYEKNQLISRDLNNYNYIKNNSQNVYLNRSKIYGNYTILFSKDYSSINFNNYFALLNGKSKKDKSIKKGFIFEKIQKLKDKDFIDPLFLSIERDHDKIPISDLLIKHLENHNIKDIFCVINDSNIHLIDAVSQNKSFNIKFFNTSENCIYSALGYANYTNDIATVILPNGKVFFDAISGIASTHLDSKKMLIIFGQSNRDNKKISRQVFSKSFDFSSTLIKLTKFYKRITNENSISKDIEQAIYNSKSNRPGVSVLEIPLTLQGKVLNLNKSLSFKPLTQNIKSIESEFLKLKKLNKLLFKSERPVVVLGNGANTIDSRNVINKFIKIFPAIFLTTRRGSDLVNYNNKKYFGRVGVYGNRSANIIINNSDLIIFIGCGLKQSLTGRNLKDFCKNSYLILVDIDKKELTNNKLKIGLKINMSSYEFISNYLEKPILKKPLLEWERSCKNIHNKNNFDNEGYKNTKKINPYIFFKKLSDFIPNKSAIFVDGLEITNYFIQGFENKKEQRIFFSTSLDQKGFSPLAILGVPQVRNEIKLISITDYLSFMNLFKDEEIIRENKNNLTYFILFNIHNSAVRGTQKDFFGDRIVGSDKIIEDRSLIKKFAYNLKFKFYDVSLKNFNLLKINFNSNNIIIVECDDKTSIQPKINFTQTNDGNWIADPLYKMYPYK